MEQTLLDIAANTWGPHPLDWPSPPPKRPPFWHRESIKRLKALEEVFGHLDNEALQRYYDEVRKGQSVYEDAGGYFLRCYRALLDERHPYERLDESRRAFTASVIDIIDGDYSHTSTIPDTMGEYLSRAQSYYDDRVYLSVFREAMDLLRIATLKLEDECNNEIARLTEDAIRRTP